MSRDNLKLLKKIYRLLKTACHSDPLAGGEASLAAVQLRQDPSLRSG